jgi:hypothetical protein
MATRCHRPAVSLDDLTAIHVLRREQHGNDYFIKHEEDEEKEVTPETCW